MSYRGFGSLSSDLVQRACLADSLQLSCIWPVTLPHTSSRVLPTKDWPWKSFRSDHSYSVWVSSNFFLRISIQPGWVFLRIALLSEALPAHSPFFHAFLSKVQSYIMVWRCSLLSPASSPFILNKVLSQIHLLHVLPHFSVFFSSTSWYIHQALKNGGHLPLLCIFLSFGLHDHGSLKRMIMNIDD